MNEKKGDADNTPLWMTQAAAAVNIDAIRILARTFAVAHLEFLESGLSREDALAMSAAYMHAAMQAGIAQNREKAD